MAEYSGVPDVLPSLTLPNNYERTDTKVAESVQRLGRATSGMGETFTQASSDNAFNLYQQDVTRILRGEPAQAEGQEQSTGYLGLNGRRALDDRPTVEKQIAELRKKYASDLAINPMAQGIFEQQATRYETQTFGQVSAHADQQSKVWFTAVNQSTADNAMAQIAATPLDGKVFAAASNELINARVKQAELAGASPGDEIWKDAVATGKREALTAQVQAIGTNDPSRALSILDKNRAVAGVVYDELYNSLRSRADEQSGIAAATSALETITGEAAATSASSYTNVAQPIYREAAEAMPGGFSPGALARLVQIESGGRADAVSPSGKHVGMTQFSEATWKEFGQGDRSDPQQSILAAQRYAVSNAKILTPVLGRPPTDAELYLAHQQGPGGARALLRNPGAPARDIVGLQAVIQNGGKPEMTAAQFVAMWTHKFNKTTPSNAIVGTSEVVAPQQDVMGLVPGYGAVEPAPAPAAVEAVDGVEVPDRQPLPDVNDILEAKTKAYQAIMDNDDLTPEAKQKALTFINQQIAALQVAEGATAQAKKQANDQAANTYMTDILNGNVTDITKRIANDNALDWGTKYTLTNALEAHMKQTGAGDVAQYGEGFFKVYQQILADPGDPSRIVDTNTILRRASPGGDLTLEGAQKLVGILGQNQKGVNEQAINTTRMGMLNYAKSKVSFQQDTGPIQIKDPKGEQLFNAVFIPRFEAGLAAWEAAGKDPWEYLTQENVDKMIGGLRTPQEMAMAKLLAQQTGMAADDIAAPPAPAGVSEDGWKLVVNATPTTKDGKAWPVANWAAVVTKLQERPTPSVIEQFNAKFAASGISAEDVMAVLGISPIEEDAAPAPEPAAAAPEPELPKSIQDALKPGAAMVAM